MQSAKTIYVDMDDVLCQTAQRFLIILEREFGKRVSFGQLTNFEIGTACSLNPQERAELYRIVHTANELLSIDPIEGAVSSLVQWAGTGYEIAIVTGRLPSTYEASLEWLARHQVPFHSFTVVDKYGRFETKNTIGITLAELAARRFSWAVEDSPFMAAYLASQMATHVALLDYPWNRSEIEHARIARYKCWDEISQALPFPKPGI
jgi:uncharacterized HAD superfamily protein